METENLNQSVQTHTAPEPTTFPTDKTQQAEESIPYATARRYFFALAGSVILQYGGTLLGCALVVTLMLFAAGAFGTNSPAYLVMNMVMASVATYGFGGAALWLGLRKLPAIPRETHRPLKPDYFIAIFTVTFACTNVIAYLTQLGLSGLELLSGGTDTIEDVLSLLTELPLVWQVVLSAVAAPVCEELLYRGVMLRHLRWAGDRSAVLLSAIFFAISHGNLQQFFYALFVGVILGCVSLRTGRLLECMLLHALINGSSILLSAFPGPVADLWTTSIYYALIVTGAVCAIMYARELTTLLRPVLVRGAPPPAKWTSSALLVVVVAIGLCICIGFSFLQLFL